MIPLTLSSLLVYFKKKYTVELQKETMQLSFMMKIGDKELPIFAAILHESLLQIIAYLPYEVKEEALNEVARFLHLINKQLDMPGFGMDEAARLLFYRAVIPNLKPEIDEDLIEAHLSTIETACRTFLEGISSLAGGNSSLEKVVRVSEVGKQIFK